MDSDSERINNSLRHILARLDALEAQVAALSGASGLAGGPAGQPAPVAGRPIPSAAYGSFGPGTGQAGPGGPGPAFPDVIQLARSGQKIQAIKLYREYTAASLQEAKAFVDNC